MFPRFYVFAVTLLLATSAAFAETEHLTQHVTFTNGRATVKGRIKGYQYVDYVFAVGAGESLNATLKTDNNINYFNLLAPGETEIAFFIGSTSGNNYQGVASTSGDYTARVYLMRSAARRGESAHYTLTITLGEKSATVERGADYADGLTGGPDFWEVTGVEAGDTLSLREEPDPHAQMIGRFGNGTVLRNLGCKNTRGQRWCRVENLYGSSMRGWVNGRYLRESTMSR
jgi:hypothetical protein